MPIDPTFAKTQEEDHILEAKFLLVMPWFFCGLERTFW